MWRASDITVCRELPIRAEVLLREKGVEDVRWAGSPFKASRNTWLLKGTVDRTEILVKLSRNSVGPRCDGEVAAYAMLQQRLKNHSFYSVPSVLARDSELGIVIVTYIDGFPLDKLIVAGAAGKPLPGGFGTEEIVKLMGGALGWFHREFANNKRARLYIDFGPKNMMLSQSGKQLFFIDPPDAEEYGEVEKDIGLTLFELTKLSFAFRRPSAFAFCPKLRRAFFWAYRNTAADRSNPYDLSKVHLRERVRYLEVTRNYLRFYAYPDWGKQLMRAAVLVPLLSLQRFLLLPIYQRYDRLANAEANHD